MSRPAWFDNAVVSGLQGLYALGLQGAPGPDVLPQTAQVWQLAIWRSRGWVRGDEDRIAVAFVHLCANVERWPTPKALLEALPDRPSVPALTHERQPPTPEQRAKLRSLLGELTQKLLRNNPKET